MSVLTDKVAGVKSVVNTAPPFNGRPHPAIGAAGRGRRVGADGGCSTVVPAQFCTQFAEDAMHLAFPQRQTSTSTAWADEERAIWLRLLAAQVAHPAIPTQGVQGAGMHRYLARLAELGLVDAQHPSLEIDTHVSAGLHAPGLGVQAAGSHHVWDVGQRRPQRCEEGDKNYSQCQVGGSYVPSTDVAGRSSVAPNAWTLL